MKTILLPTDFSGNSKNAINWAIQFYSKEEVNFILLHSYHSLQSGASSVVSINEILRKQAVEDLKNYKEELERTFENKKHTFGYEAIYGDAIHAVETTTKGKENVFVVVGAKGMSGVEKLFFGSNTSEIIKNSSTPVFVIPENVTFNSIDKIAIAVDFQKNIKDDLFQPVLEILIKSKAQLRPFYVENSEVVIDEKTEQEVTNEYVKQLNQQQFTITKINEEDPLTGVQKYIHSHNIDLLVLVNRKKSFLERLFHKSFSKQVALHTDTPLLILHD
ncbi:MAG: hypothetical protein CVT95_06120 [Bacteroidetes bacterium HGW-Bacteroidetes-12]|nr:MAG: hypothetical protein CVT95_06120 [Bacteroidetes bacterium HGW-Bacteroidetes-12]